MNHDILSRLVDLYAERELPAELEDPLESAASGDPLLRSEMISLRNTVETVRRDYSPYDSATASRILERMRQEGVEIETIHPETSLDQLRLPMGG